MREQILAALSQYGSPALFGIVLVAAVGVPLPVTLLLIVTGSLTSQGVMDFWGAVGLAGLGSVIGDQIGYAIGRWGGAGLAARLTRFTGGRKRLEAATAKARQWGGAGVFFSRWLATALGPWINLASGIARYSWPRFLIWDTLGECLGAALYVSLGRLFSDRVTELNALLGDLSWAIVALLAALAIGSKLLVSTRSKVAG